MEDLLFERLDRMVADVEPDVVLQDLYFLDRVARPLVGPDDAEYRVPYLVEALQSRAFFPEDEACWEAIELFDDLCDLCAVRSYPQLAAVIERFHVYRQRQPSGRLGES